ncbi:hypothetical protein E4U09_000216 [Claviceps aff. purpurea]|uniref:Uncharacterized protein n=1 Tax=Claviceps aff. purpurea TaxID=1967640 RepID=A0A9P7TYP2_9HYPO|nr:hypothetical protein E4U09_000216 [Claviceps aff. purpurea]
MAMPWAEIFGPSAKLRCQACQQHLVPAASEALPPAVQGSNKLRIESPKVPTLNRANPGIPALLPGPTA